MMQTENAQRAWEERLDYLRQRVQEFCGNSTVTIEDYDGDQETYAAEMIEGFSACYVLSIAEVRFVTVRMRELVGIEE